MKAFVLAAGIGIRLRSLTNNIPKPMIPILGKPALYYTFANLLKNGFNDICVNLYCHPNGIINFFKDNDVGIKLEFSHERILLGTAGAIKNKENFLIIHLLFVMSGDILTDINLSKAVDFHKKTNRLPQ
jgi:mannose-1-phosphate guanylyltransferase/phosphomannomutase